MRYGQRVLTVMASLAVLASVAWAPFACCARKAPAARTKDRPLSGSVTLRISSRSTSYRMGDAIPILIEFTNEGGWRSDIILPYGGGGIRMGGLLHWEVMDEERKAVGVECGYQILPPSYVRVPLVQGCWFSFERAVGAIARPGDVGPYWGGATKRGTYTTKLVYEPLVTDDSDADLWQKALTSNSVTFRVTE